MERQFCFNCKRWIDKDEFIHHTNCDFRFCACETGRPCHFHARGGYTTPEDDIKEP